MDNASVSAQNRHENSQAVFTFKNALQACKDRIQTYFRISFFLTLALICSTATLSAQEPVNVSLDSFAHDLQLITQKPHALEYEIVLGNSSQNAEGVAGYHFYGSLNDLGGSSVNLSASIDESWIGDKNEGELAIVHDPTTGDFEIFYQRNDVQGQSGYGHALHLKITPVSGQNLPLSAHANVGGLSIIMVDNAGFKRQESNWGNTKLNTLSSFPNPCQTRIQFSGPAESGTWMLVATSGQVLQQGKGNPPPSLDMNPYAPGVYRFVFHTDNRTYSSNILKK